MLFELLISVLGIAAVILTVNLVRLRLGGGSEDDQEELNVDQENDVAEALKSMRQDR